MTEQEYIVPITTFHSGATVNPVKTIPIMEEGKSALMKLNNERGLGFDDFDLNFYTDLFKVCVCIYSYYYYYFFVCEGSIRRRGGGDG
jgi:hypothetical protein